MCFQPLTAFLLSFLSFLETSMSYIITGFADGGAWARTAEGDIVGHPRDSSYKEILRTGIPILYYCENKSAPMCESVLPTISSRIVCSQEPVDLRYDLPCRMKSRSAKRHVSKPIRVDKSRTKRSHRRGRPDPVVCEVDTEPDETLSASWHNDEQEEQEEPDYWFYMHFY